MRRTDLITAILPTTVTSQLIVLLTVGMGCLLTPVTLAMEAPSEPIVAGYRFTSFDAPGAAVSGLTDPHHINNHGVITGVYWDSNFIRHGFVRTTNGVITSLDPPSSVNTDAEGINDSGDVVGFYKDANSTIHGFRGITGA